MPTWATSNSEVIALVRGLLPANPTAFSTTTIPTLVQVDAWLDEAEDLVRGSLTGARISIPTGTTAINQLGTLTTRYAVGKVKNLIDTSGGGPGDAGQVDIDEFNKVCEHMLMRPDYWARRLDVEPAIASHARGLVLNNDDDLTIADGDFAAEFTRDEKF